MRKRKVIRQLQQETPAIRPRLVRRGPCDDSFVQGVGPYGAIEGLPEDFPRYTRPGAWRGVFSGYEMSRAWHEGYHAGVIRALGLLEGKGDA